MRFPTVAFIPFSIAVIFATPVRAATDFQTFQPATTVLGQTYFTNISDSAGLPNRFDEPEGVAVDPTTGKVFISDAGNNRVLRFSSAAALQIGANPEAVIGQPNFSSFAANQAGPASAQTMSFPFGITVDSQGRLWVADNNNNRVLGFFVASSLGNNPPADVVLGQPDAATVTSGTSPIKMNDPAGVFVGPNDELWVADSNNDRVLRFDAVTGKTTGDPADGVLGQLDFVTNGDGVSATEFNDPNSLFADSVGRLWVADTFNHRVLRFDAAAGKVNGAAADAVVGQPDFDTNVSGTSAQKFRTTYGVYFDPLGNLWVGDYNNERVLRFPDALSITTGGTADLVLGKPNFAASSGLASARTFGGPSQIAPGSGGSLLVVDYDFNRVLRFDPINTPNAPEPVAPTAGISVLGKKKVFTSAKRIRIKGRADDAVRIEFKAGKGGFKNAKGNVRRWKVTLRLKSRRTVLKVRAVNADGVVTRPEKVVILQR